MNVTTMHSFVFIAYLAPILLLVVAVSTQLQPRLHPYRVFQYRAFQFARAAAAASLLLALFAAATVFIRGIHVTPLLGIGDIGFSIRLDALSVVMFVLVASMGLLVVQFSRNYLDGDAGQTKFFGDLALTVGAVILLVLSGNLFQLVVAWVGTSLALNRLLLFYGDRRSAAIAARKKFIAARVGDICLAIAALLIVQAFGTGDLGALAEAAKSALANGAIPAGVSAATILVVIAAALKSAMFPMHGWLLEVMETPTPVSALLHAGLLNAGTFLIVRLGELVFLFTPALHLLIIIGGFTALFASVAMITQSSVKVSLAYSSAAHMGFMLMLCGFGAHSVAIMHLVAHSFYKAHAFLASGSIVEYVQAMGSQENKGTPRPWALVVSLATALLIFVGIGMLLGIDLTKRPGEVALGMIFVMGTTHLLARALTGSSQFFVISRTALVAVAVTLAFFALELTAAWLLAGTVAAFPPPDTMTLVIMGSAVIAFALVLLSYSLLPLIAATPIGRAAYVHLKNGFYANALLDRLIGTLRFNTR